MKNKILVIDDDQAICIFLSVVLSKSFYVSTAHDGMGAMYLLSEGNIPDLIITDLEMPNLSGIELIENLKKSRLYRNIVRCNCSFKGSYYTYITFKCKR